MREAHLRALESAEAAAVQARQTAELAAKRAAVTAEAAARKLQEVDLEKVKEDMSVRARAAADAAAEKVRRSLPLPFLSLQYSRSASPRNWIALFLSLVFLEI